jgi:lipoprotein-releasing system permease protein
MPYELQIALRYLTARRKQAFISVISAISVLGVVVGVMALMIALGLMTGLQREIRSKILGATAHVSVFRSGSEPFEDYRPVAQRLRQVPGVLGAAPAVYNKALLTTPGGANVATLKGIDPLLEGTVTDLPKQVEDGGSLARLVSDGEGPPPVLLGRDLAATLGVGVGDIVSVTSPEGRLTPMGMLPRVSKFRVAGTVHSGLYEFDAQWAYVSMGTAQRLFTGGADRATLVEVRLDDLYKVKDASDRILKTLGPGYVTTDWIATNQSLFSALWLEKVAIGITIGLIVVVAAMNIIATLILMVMEKHKDIAILVSMGASRRSITGIFMLQGTVIGALGTLTGGVLGWGLCRILDHFKLIRVPVDVYQVSYVPFTLLPGDAAVVIAGAVLVCFLATVHPARGAAKLDPAEALRYE